jgi:DNA recombination protein RmuC
MSSLALIAMILAASSIILSLICYRLWGKASECEQRAQVAELNLAKAAASVAEIERLTEEIDSYRREVESWRDAAHTNETTARVLEEKIRSAEAQKHETEQLKQQFEQYAKAAALSAGGEIATKLLADHQREREQALKLQQGERETTYKQFEQFTKTATEQFIQRQHELTQALGKMQGQMDLSHGQLSVLVRAMKHPIGAGAEGEIMLDNLLRQLGLQAGQDYQLQVHLAGEESSLRPDGVIFLPNEQALVVDAKASQHIYALYEAEGTPQYDEVFDKLCASMRAHVKALSSKNYRAEVSKWMAREQRTVTRVMLAMFVPNDAVVTRLRQHEPELIAEMARHEIILAGPATLPAVCMVAATMIREARQKEEQHAIIELTAALMSDVITALSRAEKIINGIRSSAKAFDEFAASINRGVLSKMRRITAKGLMPAKNQPLPANLTRYDISKADDTLEGEAEEITDLLSLSQDKEKDAA